MQRLNDLANIRVGVSARSRLVPSPKGEVRVVQVKDLNHQGGIDIETVFRVDGLRFKPVNKLQPGDVLIQTRGERYRASVVPDALAGAIAASPLYVIRPDRDRLDPVYLYEFLSLPRTQATLRREATGTYIPNLRAAVLAELRVVLPPLAIQHRLAELGALAQCERALLDDLAEQRRNLFSAVIKAAAEKTQGRGNAPGS